MIDPLKQTRQRAAVELHAAGKERAVRGRCVSCHRFIERHSRRCESCLRAMSPAGLRHATLSELLELHRAIEAETARREAAMVKRAG